MSGHGLTVRQKQAVKMLRDHGVKYRGEADFYGQVTADATALCDGQPWINWRTAYALQRRGLARVEDYGDGCEVILLG